MYTWGFISIFNLQQFREIGKMFCFLVCLVYLCGTYDKHGKCKFILVIESGKFKGRE